MAVSDMGAEAAADRAGRAQLESLFCAGVAAVEGGAAVRRSLAMRHGRVEIAGRPLADRSRLVVLAAGKAAAAMAGAVEEVAGDTLRGGLVVTKDGHGAALDKLVLREAGHPVPDARCALAAREAEALVAGMSPDDTLLVLLSGGASALLGCPAASLDREDVAELTRLLLACGADIVEMNAVRKHVSGVSGIESRQPFRLGRVWD